MKENKRRYMTVAKNMHRWYQHGYLERTQA